MEGVDREKSLLHTAAPSYVSFLTWAFGRISNPGDQKFRLSFQARRPLPGQAELRRTKFIVPFLSTFTLYCFGATFFWCYLTLFLWQSFVWTLFVTNFCDKFLWRIVLTNFCDVFFVANFCGEFLWRIFLRFFLTKLSPFNHCKL